MHTNLALPKPHIRESVSGPCTARRMHVIEFNILRDIMNDDITRSDHPPRISTMPSTIKEIDLDHMLLSADQACALLRVLANRDRLMLLCQMTQGEFCVTELETALGIEQPTLSQQLTVLRQENLVTTRREGKQIFYTIASPEAMAVMQVLYEQFCQPKQKKSKNR